MLLSQIISSNHGNIEKNKILFDTVLMDIEDWNWMCSNNYKDWDAAVWCLSLDIQLYVFVVKFATYKIKIFAEEINNNIYFKYIFLSKLDKIQDNSWMLSISSPSGDQ